MARMRGPDYGSMLRAIYEPKLKRQTAKEENQLKRDALNESIRHNKEVISQSILDRQSREDIVDKRTTSAETISAANIVSAEKLPGIRAGAQYQKGVGLLREQEKIGDKRWGQDRAYDLYKFNRNFI